MSQNIIIMGAVMADTIDSLLEKGVTPSVSKSVNFPSNVEYNNKMNADYNKTGF